ncbi:MAG: hypothetical protein AAGJ40_24215 [Planctomycetota bacterium]
MLRSSNTLLMGCVRPLAIEDEHRIPAQSSAYVMVNDLLTPGALTADRTQRRPFGDARLHREWAHSVSTGQPGTNGCNGPACQVGLMMVESFAAGR